MALAWALPFLLALFTPARLFPGYLLLAIGRAAPRCVHSLVDANVDRQVLVFRYFPAAAVWDGYCLLDVDVVTRRLYY
jgi:hypothetical protein